MNLFPFLPLDGGHIFWAIVEKVRGRPVSLAVMERAGVVGFMLVIVLFLIGLSNDIGRLSGEGFRCAEAAGADAAWAVTRGEECEMDDAPPPASRARSSEARARAPATVAEAFQFTAAAHARPRRAPHQGRRVLDHLGRVRRARARTAGGLAALGLERGDTVALMLTNRPEFHWFDAAALHLGATPFSLYNTYTAEQIEYLLDDAAARILVTEQEFADRGREA